MTSSNWYLIEKGITKEISEATLTKIEESLGVNLKENFRMPIAA
jgi:hypothetical protein